MQTKSAGGGGGGMEGVQKACKIVYVINGRPLSLTSCIDLQSEITIENSG